MKMLTAIFATVALAAVLATPVLAQSVERRLPPQRNLQNQFYGQSGERPHSTNPAYDVYDGGQYVGSDPDPNVRQQLRRDYEGRW
jgi:hypothetical protein